MAILPLERHLPTFKEFRHTDLEKTNVTYKSCGETEPSIVAALGNGSALPTYLPVVVPPECTALTAVTDWRNTGTLATACRPLMLPLGLLAPPLLVRWQPALDQVNPAAALPVHAFAFEL